MDIIYYVFTIVSFVFQAGTGGTFQPARLETLWQARQRARSSCETAATHTTSSPSLWRQTEAPPTYALSTVATVSAWTTVLVPVLSCCPSPPCPIWCSTTWAPAGERRNLSQRKIPRQHWRKIQFCWSSGSLCINPKPSPCYSTWSASQ